MVSDEVDIIVDKSKIKPERTATWIKIKEFPDLAASLAGRHGDFGRVELGYEVKGKHKVKGWLLSMARAIGDNLYHSTEIYPEAKFKGRDTAMKFRNDSIVYFMEIEAGLSTKH